MCRNYDPRRTKVQTIIDGNGGHRYILTTDLCAAETCNPDDVYTFVNENSIPFTDDFHDGHQ